MAGQSSRSHACAHPVEPGDFLRRETEVRRLQQITELLTHVAFYAGVPAAVTGFRVAREVFAGTEQSAPQR